MKRQLHTHGELAGRRAERVDASADPQPDLGNASGGSTVARSSHPSHSETHRFSHEFFDACVFVGGNTPHQFVSPVVHRCNTIVAADSGWRHALSVGVTPSVVLGDFDSITADELREVHEANVPLIEYPSNKDLTDAEIALQYIVDSDATSLLLVSGGGDRFDHLLSLMHALCDRSLSGLRRCAIVGDTRIDIVTASHAISLSSDHGQIVSLVPISGDARGVSTTGLRWPLHAGDLQTTKSRGVSNVVMNETFSVSVLQGHLAVIQPHYFPPYEEITS
jgi:thiamine pyrophosphokinase